MVVHLELSGKLSKHHLILHVLLLLHRYLQGGDGVEPPAPVSIKDVDEFKVEALIIHR